MTSMLQEEIKQARPFDSLREEVWLNLQRTSALLGHKVEQELRPRGLSPTQYNVLRILRGADARGLCQYEIGGRLVAQVPDVPRILERMERAGWVRRDRGEQDRRMVIARLTETGRAIVDELDAPMQHMMRQMFSGMDDQSITQLNELLVEARQTSRTSKHTADSSS